MAKKKIEAEEEEMVPVGPGIEGDEPEEEDEDEGESKASAESESGDSDEDDERVGHGEDEEGEENSEKESRKAERKRRKELQRRARDRNNLELKFLRDQNQQLEQRLREINTRIDKTEVGSIDQRISSIQSQLKVADQVLAQAHDTGTGAEVVEAENIRDKLKDHLGRLTHVKTSMEQRRSTESESAAPVDPRMMRFASDWISRNPWYDPERADRDSRKVGRIDNELVQEGYEPNTPEYWEELTDRVKEALPHRFRRRMNGREEGEEEEDDRETPRKRSSGPRFSTGGRERSLRKNEVYIDPGRKQAMIDAGVWDDKVLRNKYLKKYAEWDRENPRGRSAR